jgi:hypothetical protein
MFLFGTEPCIIYCENNYKINNQKVTVTGIPLLIANILMYLKWF